MNRFTRRGFTLVEVLIVLGIMVALAGLLFPLVARGRESAQRVQCLNNVRQLTQAWLAYAGDNDRHFCGSGLSQGWDWLGILPDVIRTGKLWPYVQNLDPYRCPSETTAAELKPFSYAINGLLAGPIGAPFTLRRLEDIAQPPKTFVFIEMMNPQSQRISGTFLTPIYPSNVFALASGPGQIHRGGEGVRGGDDDQLRRRARDFLAVFGSADGEPAGIDDLGA